MKETLKHFIQSKTLLLPFLLTISSFSQTLYGEPRLPINHAHNGRTHVHLLPIEGLNHTHNSGKKVSKKQVNLIKIIKNPVVSRDNRKYGFYSKDQVRILWLNQGRKAKLLETLIFTDPKGEKWVAPKGHIIDGASIPVVFQPFIGTPYGGNYVMASIIHDVACDNKKRSWEEVHKTFHYAMLSSGVSIGKANLMYEGVYKGGPRWGEDVEKPLTEEGLKALLNTERFNTLTEMFNTTNVSITNGGLTGVGGIVNYTKEKNSEPVAIGFAAKKNDFTARVEFKRDGGLKFGVTISPTHEAKTTTGEELFGPRKKTKNK